MSETPIRVEIEVEYVRTEKIVFTGDLSSGLSSPGVPWEVGRFMSLLQYHMHANKDLVKREVPRLIGWQVLDTQCICNKGDAHEHRTVAHLNRCARCMCSCEPEPVAREDGEWVQRKPATVDNRSEAGWGVWLPTGGHGDAWYACTGEYEAEWLAKRLNKDFEGV